MPTHLVPLVATSRSFGERDCEWQQTECAGRRGSEWQHLQVACLFQRLLLRQEDVLALLEVGALLEIGGEAVRRTSHAAAIDHVLRQQVLEHAGRAAHHVQILHHVPARRRRVTAGAARSSAAV